MFYNSWGSAGLVSIQLLGWGLSDSDQFSFQSVAVIILSDRKQLEEERKGFPGLHFQVIFHQWWK